jgi:hypothetical protein
MANLIDTNIVIGLLRGYRNFITLFKEELLKDELFISVISRAEIMAGARPHEKRATYEILEQFISLPIDSLIADRAGEFVFDYKKIGITLHIEDCLIGATCLVHKLSLITSNTKHFPMLQDRVISFPD